MATTTPTNPQLSSTPIDTSGVLSIILRYSILVLLYFIVFYYFRMESTQFILFIVLFIILFFTILFLFRDFLSIRSLMFALFNPDFNFDFTAENSSYVKIFVFVILITLLLQFCGTAVVIAVFDYGKKSTNDFNTYKLTLPNMLIMTQYKKILEYFFIFLFLFSYMIVVNFSTGKIKNILLNISGIIVSILLLILASYSMYLAVEFFKNKKFRRDIYQ
jgi:hypothetical protein